MSCRIHFPVHTLETAPVAARPALAGVQSAYGMIPNTLGVMATEPPVLAAYLALSEQFLKTRLTPLERDIVLLAASHANSCRYCVAAHLTIGTSQGMPREILEAASRGEKLPDVHLEAIRHLTQTLVERRGFLSEEEINAFFRAGYTPADFLAVSLGVSLKTLSNYINHFAETPIDEAFQH